MIFSQSESSVFVSRIGWAADCNCRPTPAWRQLIGQRDLRIDAGGESQVLIGFRDFFGSADQQQRIPTGSRIVAAKLTVVAFDPGSTVYLHRVLVPWDESATWDGMACGLSVNNVAASTVRDDFNFGEINMDKQSVEFDVTNTVRKWAAGEPNHGWVFVSTGSNGWDFYSSDWIEQELRPSLEIQFVPPPNSAQSPASLSTRREKSAGAKDQEIKK
jgi:hypothetical protein